jgi:hypothetical protein
MEGKRQEVAGRLSALVGMPDVVIREDDFWMPCGLPFADGRGGWDATPAREAKLGDVNGFLPNEHRSEITKWWLAVSPEANTPNWDIASTCTVEGKKGLLLIEAKAHDSELRNEEVGKRLKPPVTTNSLRNHARIGACIQEASLALAGETSRPWALSRDWNYQMSNRFSWAWKAADLGHPVILMYLGFLQANEMKDRGKPFADHTAWKQLVNSHSQRLFPNEV